jgi:putative membrane protein
MPNRRRRPRRHRGPSAERETRPIRDPNLDNLRLAYERTALSWTSTSLALIGFGFTIDKFFEGIRSRGEAPFPINPQSLGITMIGFGLLSLALSLVELRQFRKSYPEAPHSSAGFVAGMIAILGFMAMAAAIFS